MTLGGEGGVTKEPLRKGWVGSHRGHLGREDNKWEGLRGRVCWPSEDQRWRAGVAGTEWARWRAMGTECEESCGTSKGSVGILAFP